jgi:hypothetical protein
MVETRRPDRPRAYSDEGVDADDRLFGARALRGDEFPGGDGSLATEFGRGAVNDPQGSPPDDAGFAAPYSRHSSGYGAFGHQGRPDDPRPWQGGRDDPKPLGTYRGRGPKNYHRSDERIREEVCERLTDDEFLDASNVEVEVKGGEVTLSGTVETRGLRHRAEDIADMVQGVAHLQNNLRVDRSRA